MSNYQKNIINILINKIFKYKHKFIFINRNINSNNIFYNELDTVDSLISNLHKILSSNNNKAKALVLNYPNNPTTRVASLDFFKEVVDICIKYEVYILSDIAYAEIYFDGEIPPSILEVPKAKNIAVEFSSLSKTYSMPG